MDRTVDIVLAWHDALNAGDIALLVALSTQDVRVGGPRGSGHGSDLLRQWFDRAGISIAPRSIFKRADTVVVEQDAWWQSAADGGVIEPQRVVSVFKVRDDLIASIVRFSDVTSALRATGLTEADRLISSGDPP